MNILFFLACWKRPEITEICFIGLQRLKAYDPDRFRVSALAVISETEMIPLCEKYGIKWLMHENKPLGKKKNAGLNEAFKYDWDYLIELGSDDLVRNELLDLYEPFMKQGLPLMGMKNIVFLNSENGEARQYDSAEVYGLGRCMSRKMLEQSTKSVECEVLQSFIGSDGEYAKGNKEFVHVDKVEGWERASFIQPIGEVTYHLWKDTINQGLDSNSNYFLMQKGIPLRHIHTSEPLALDIKGKENIWKYNDKIGRDYSAEDFLKHVSEVEQYKLSLLVKEYA